MQQDRHVLVSGEPEQLQGLEDRILAWDQLLLYKAEVGMTTSSEKFVGIDVAKDKLDIAVLGEKKASQVGNDEDGIASLIKKMQKLGNKISMFFDVFFCKSNSIPTPSLVIIHHI